ncbi:MAG: hypothetical protein FWD79_10275 [Desulfobulbus sp.]|nr:hypothetical protein [Desulfobulbus sp.]
MVDALTLIEQAAMRYRHLDLLGERIEKTIQDNKFAALPELCECLNALQEQVQAHDSQLFEVLQQHQELHGLDATKEWLQRMRDIQKRNQRLVPHLKSIMTIQRDELRTLQKGNSMLQGYRPGNAQMERRFSSSG